MLMVCIGASFTALIMPNLVRNDKGQISIGEVSTMDIHAPYSLSYSSKILTDQRRNEAEKNIPPVYLPADPTISRNQIGKLLAILNYINIIRKDSFATTEQKLEDIAAINEVSLSPETAQMILELSDESWQAVQFEALSVLEQVMRETITPADLSNARNRINILISYSLSQEQAEIISDLVSDLVKANSMYSQAQTESARKEARDSVEAVTQSFIAGETIVSRGQIITPLIWEALEQYDLITPADNRETIFSSAVISAVFGVLIPLYLRQKNTRILNTRIGVIVLGFLFVLFLGVARFIVPERVVLPYIFPIAAFGMTVAGLYGLEISFILTLALSISAAFQLPFSMDLTIYYLLPSLIGILILGNGRRISSFIAAGLTIGAAGSAIILAYRIPDQVTDWIGIATLVGASFVNGVASASGALILRYIFAVFLRVLTPFQLLELSRPDHPLLQLLLRSAPGTYQHSLQVANLAERAAEEIGADALLTRVGALFHDVGKVLNPNAFIENQLPGQENPHDSLDPFTSAEWILQHVSDGVQIAKKYRIPPRIQDFIKEHHGTLLARYQYSKALGLVNNDYSKVDEQLFRYPGPIPQSRETALIMFADGCEARARAELPQTEEHLKRLVREQIQFYRDEGQLDHTDFTFRDLQLVEQSFVATLKSTLHMRLIYPKIQTKTRKNLLGDKIKSKEPTSVISSSGIDNEEI